MEGAGATSGSAQKENEEDNASIQVQAKRLCMSIHAAAAEHARQKEEVEGNGEATHPGLPGRQDQA